MTLRPFMKYHSPPYFPSRNTTKNAVTYLPPMRDVIIEQPLIATWICSKLLEQICRLADYSRDPFLEPSAHHRNESSLFHVRYFANKILLTVYSFFELLHDFSTMLT